MCYAPISILVKPKKGGEPYRQSVGCGKCPDCVSKVTTTWRQRLLMQCGEDEKYTTVWFVTFTYANRFLPKYKYIIDHKANYLPVPSVRDIQLFHKRLRRTIDYKGLSLRFKYFLASEYTPLNKRPHYHAVYFCYGVDRGRFRSLIKEVWKNGFTDVQVSKNIFKSSSYVANYVSLSGVNPYSITRENSSRTDCKSVNTFRLFSQGLGKEFFQKYVIKRVKENLKSLSISNPSVYRDLKVLLILKQNSHPQVWRTYIESHWRDYVHHIYYLESCYKVSAGGHSKPFLAPNIYLDNYPKLKALRSILGQLKYFYNDDLEFSKGEDYYNAKRQYKMELLKEKQTTFKKKHLKTENTHEW